MASVSPSDSTVSYMASAGSHEEAPSPPCEIQPLCFLRSRVMSASCFPL